jgi:hypothetical protein
LKPTRQPGLSPTTVIKAAQALGVKSVLLAFSCGKDSIVSLDLCVRAFPNVQPYFLYWIRDLGFQELTLRWAERKYGLKILRLPHAFLSQIYTRQDFRHDDAIPEMKRTLGLTDQENAIRAQTGIQFIAGGQGRRLFQSQTAIITLKPKQSTLNMAPRMKAAACDEITVVVRHFEQ